MTAFLLVGLGGAIGSMARLGLFRLVPSPLGTALVNVSGGFLMGLALGLLAPRADLDPLRLFMLVGLLGGFTTFSAFSLDALRLAQRGDWPGLAAYVGGSVLLSILALAAGLRLARTVAP